MTTDLTYSCTDGIWTRFYPETPAGDDAYNVMAAADPDGVVAFMANQVPGVLRQLKAAGLTVRKAKSAKLDSISDDELLALLGRQQRGVHLSPAIIRARDATLERSAMSS